MLSYICLVIIGILGPNGAGKSTLLNLMLDKLKPVTGYVHRNANLKIAAFTQHHAEQFDYRYTLFDILYCDAVS
jgi:ATPase subunit of ABC transporter with duplicated ATPase domains